MGCLLVVCDVEKKSGLGHYTRTQALISELTRFNYQIKWVVHRDIPEYILAQIKEKKQGVVLHNGFEQIIDCLGQLDFDHIIIDSYHIPKKIRIYIRNTYKCSKIVSIQDTLPYLHSDIYINHNMTLSEKEEYRNSDGSIVLSGENFMMIDFKKFIRKNEYPSFQIKKILIFFGGTSRLSLIETTLIALYKNEENLQIDIFTIDNDVEHLSNIIKKYCTKHEINIFIISPMVTIEYFKYDLCVGSLGMSAWERIYVGLPSICVVIAENQKLISEMLSNRKVIILANKNNLEERIIDVFNNPKLRLELFTNSKKILSGNSTAKLADKLNKIIEH